MSEVFDYVWTLALHVSGGYAFLAVLLLIVAAAYVAATVRSLLIALAAIDAWLEDRYGISLGRYLRMAITAAARWWLGYETVWRDRWREYDRGAVQRKTWAEWLDEC